MEWPKDQNSAPWKMDRLAKIILRLHGKYAVGSLLRYEDERVEISGELSQLVFNYGHIHQLEVAERLPAGPYYDERVRSILFMTGPPEAYRVQHYYEHGGQEILEHLLRLVPLEALADVDGG